MFETCGGAGDGDKHQYVITVGSDNAQLQVIHQHPRITDVLESDNFQADIIGSDKRVGVRQIGIWSDNDYTRHLWILLDEKGDNNWKPVTHWSDKGQYTALVRKFVKGAFKSPPPYHFFPYGEESALMRIKVIGDIASPVTWCRQINAEKDIHNILNNGPVKVIGDTLAKKDTKAIWNSDETLKINAERVPPGTYANDETNTILFAAAEPNTQSMFGISNGDAIWTGIDARWCINHHLLVDDLINSSIEFNMIMGAANQIIIQLGNRSVTGWVLANDFAFGGYEFIITNEGKVSSRIEYYYGVDDSARKTSSYGIENELGAIKDFDPFKEIAIRMSVKNKDKDVIGLLNVGGKPFQKVWKPKDWLLREHEIPKGRVDSKQLVSLYQGPKQHWSIHRYRTGNQNDNGSLINKIRVYKL